MARPSRSFSMHRAIRGLWVPWNALIAPQAMVMNRQGKIGWSAGPREPSPSQISGREGHLMKRHTIRATAIKSRAKAKRG